MASLVDYITDQHETEELERAAKIKERWDLYEGRHPDTLPVVRGNEGRPDVNDNVKYNASGITVDRGVAALFGGYDQEITFALQEDAPLVEPPGLDDSEEREETEQSESPDQEWLEDCWAANSKKTLLSDMATNGGVCGHVFVRLYETGAKLDTSMPRMLNLDPACVSPVYDDDDYELVLGWKIQFRSASGKQRRTLIEPNIADLDGYEPGQNVTWKITDQATTGERGAAWENIAEPTVWSYPFPPVLDWKNLPRPNEYWGKADIEDDVRDLNFSMNRALSSMQRVLRLHGHPKPYAIGATPEQIQLLVQGVDRILTLPTGVVMGQLEMSGDLSAAMEYLRQLKSAFSDVAMNPQIDPEKLGSIGGLSGVALRILYQPLLEQTGTKRGTYGDGLLELNKRLLLLGKISPSPVVIGWPDPLPRDIKETTDSLVAAKQLGLSNETGLEQLGYDPALETERRANDDTDMGTAMAGVLNSPAFNSGAGQ